MKFSNEIIPQNFVFVRYISMRLLYLGFISTYVDNGTAKFPLLDKIGVHVQGLTSKICN